MVVLQPDVLVSGPNAVTTSTAAVECPDGFISKVQPLDLSGGALPHGRYYVQVILLKSSVVSASEAVGILWAGYLTVAAVVSIPNCPVARGQGIALRVVAGSGGVANEHIAANVEVLESGTPNPGGAFIYSERPGDGPGELRSIALGDPAAGTEYAIVTVPNRVRWEIEGHQTPLVTSATVAARKQRVQVDDGANVYKGSVASGTQAASLTLFWTGCRAAVPSSDVAQVGAIEVGEPPGQIPGAHRISIVTVNLQAGDDYGVGRMGVREWAVDSV